METNVLGVMLGCKEVRPRSQRAAKVGTPYAVDGQSGHRASASSLLFVLHIHASLRLHQVFVTAVPNSSCMLPCVTQAIRVMREQPTGGHIFNMDGAGADGGATPRFAAYGATKRGLVQLSKSLQVCAARLRASILLITVHANASVRDGSRIGTVQRCRLS